MKENNNPTNGTGTRLGDIVVILAGVAAIFATLLTVVSVWLQTKNYRKPLLQRYVIRILLMVPIYSAASWASLESLKVAFWVDPFRDIYEAFTLYTFTQLLINFLGGERSLILMTHGRPPISHLWPLNYFLPKIDISDPHTFLAIKRGILQYTWVKPLLAVATIIMKATSTYQEGYIAVDSGYFWTGLIYNVSIGWSLYCLAVFWICMSHDLQPFRPMPKFLCIKGIIFASWWQGFFLSILVWLRAIPDDVPGYTPDNLATAIQDALICFEMPFFALAHWYAFSWHDYADSTISAARMPIRFALRDAFGPRDLIEDTKETLAGKNYDYRYFDAHDNVIAHEESRSRLARMREGMRYERDGKGKYWIPSPGQSDHRTPLLDKVASSRARTMSPGKHSRLSNGSAYGTASGEDDDEPPMDPDDEHLYANARALEFGDWNYPVITAHEARREHYLYQNPPILTQSTNRNILQPTRDNKHRRKSQIQKIQQSPEKGKHRTSDSSSSQRRSSKLTQVPVLGPVLQCAESSSSGKTQNSQLVDLVIEDHDAEEVERVRARKEGGPAWNEVEQKHFVRAYPDDTQVEEVRESFDPDASQPQNPEKIHTPGSAFAIADDDDDDEGGEESAILAADERTHWQRRDVNAGERDGSGSKGKGKERSPNHSMHEEENPWQRGEH